MPGFSGDEGVPEYVLPGTGGLFITAGSAALGNGAFTSGLPTNPHPFVAIDYEGGLVQRHSEVLGRIPSAREQAATMSPDQVRDLATTAGATMRGYGIDLDFAPVVDLDLGSPIVDSRSYGSDPAQVVAYAGAFSAGLRQAGVQPVIKHFPGHGSANGDSHKGAVVTDDWEVLRTRDVPVFTEILQQPGPWMVMMGHLIVPGLSSDGATPTSVDPAAYRALREATGFNGPVITDDLSRMRAILDLYSVPQAVVAVITAGADLALLSMPDDYEASLIALTEWGDSGLANRQRLIDSATRAMKVLPCGRSG